MKLPTPLRGPIVLVAPPRPLDQLRARSARLLHGFETRRCALPLPPALPPPHADAPPQAVATLRPVLGANANTFQKRAAT